MHGCQHRRVVVVAIVGAVERLDCAGRKVIVVAAVAAAAGAVVVVARQVSFCVVVGLIAAWVLCAVAAAEVASVIGDVAKAATWTPACKWGVAVAGVQSRRHR